MAKKYNTDIVQILNNIDLNIIEEISCIFESNEFDPVSKGYIDSFSILLFQKNVVSALRLSAQSGKVSLALIDDTEFAEYLEISIENDQVDPMFLSLAYFAKMASTSYLQEKVIVDMSCFMDALSRQSLDQTLVNGILNYETKLNKLKKETSLEHNEQIFAFGRDNLSYSYSTDKSDLKDNTLELYTEFEEDGTIDPLYVAVWITDKNNESKEDNFQELDPLVFTSRKNMDIYFEKFLNECFVEWRRKMNNAYKNSLI